MKQLNDHIRAQELFSAYIDNQVAADEKNFIERHLAICDRDCRAVLAATRSMIKATKSLPAMRAPKSFVLPKSMERQQARSIFEWYPVMRLATSIAIVAFIVVFAADALTPRTINLSNNIPNSANAPQLMNSVAVPVAPTTEANAAAPAQAPIAASLPQTQAKLLPTPTLTNNSAAGSAMSIAPAITETNITTADAITASQPIALMAATPEATIEPAPESAPAGGAIAARQADQTNEPAKPIETETGLSPLRLIEIILGALAIGLIVITLIVRQRARNS